MIAAAASAATTSAEADGGVGRRNRCKAPTLRSPMPRIVAHGVKAAGHSGPGRRHRGCAAPAPVAAVPSAATFLRS